MQNDECTMQNGRRHRPPVFDSAFFIHHSAFRHRPRPAYTIVEMLTTVAVLIIVLGVMVSMARHVRERAAVALTKDLLRQLDGVMAEYAGRHGGQLPAVSPFPPAAPGAAADATTPSARPAGDAGTGVE